MSLNSQVRQTSVALSGDQALIGAKEEENGRGAAIVYRWNGSTWQQETLLKATDRAEEDKFGQPEKVAHHFYLSFREKRGIWCLQAGDSSFLSE